MIKSEIQCLSALAELFSLDLGRQGGPVLCFHAGSSGLHGDLVWQRQIYTQFPVQTEGFKQSTSGALPRPILSASNINGYPFTAALPGTACDKSCRFSASSPPACDAVMGVQCISVRAPQYMVITFI